MDRALQRLSGMRGSSGAYSLWGGPASNRDVWLTAYAVGFLQDVRDRGFGVPDASLDRSRGWLLQQVQQAPSGFGTWSAVLRAAVQGGRIPDDAQNVLRDDHRRFAGLAAARAGAGARRQGAAGRRCANCSTTIRSGPVRRLPLVQLAAAFKLMGDADRARAALDAAMRRPYGFGTTRGGVDEWLGDYGSAVRDLAPVLCAHAAI